MRLYAYAGCLEAHDCEKGYAIADHYAFSASSICDYQEREIMFHPFSNVTGALGTRFKTSGYEGCMVKPELDTGLEDPFHEWGTLDCGNGLGGSCTTSGETDKEPLICSERLDILKPSAGNVLQMMAVCDF